jgi:SAM-dependent methyltransferase
VGRIRWDGITRRVDDFATIAEAGLRRRSLVAAAATAPAPRAVFANTTDRVWWWANTAGYRASPELRRVVPGLPAKNIQERFTGDSGDSTLREAYRFHLLVRDLAEAHMVGGYAGCGDILDYGCGWGRIIRFFTRHFEPDRLVGIDCLPAAIDVCRSTNKWATFGLVEPLPPTTLAAERFDLAYSYSVFSHLAEDVHRRWIEELHRVVRPGGLLVATTRPRAWIAKSAGLRAARERGEPGKDSGGTRAFADSEAWLARYDAGMFCHDGVGGGPGLDGSLYGETLIPRAYAEQAWRPWFTVVDYLNDGRRCDQDVIVAVRVD